jgi:hypothetical protein
MTERRTPREADAVLSPRDLIAAELAGWRDSIAADSWTQDHALYRPSKVMGHSCTLALIEAGIAEPDPFACKRIEVEVDRLGDEDCHRACSSLDATPRLFAEGRGLLGPRAPGHSSIGALAPEEWAQHGIAVIWWRPHDEDLRHRYVETQPGAPLSLGAETQDKWEIPYRPVLGPPIPNNHCDPPHWVRPLWPWTHAVDRQLDLLAESSCT